MTKQMTIVVIRSLRDKYAQNVQIYIILHMPKVSSWHLLSRLKHSIVSNDSVADREGPDQTTHAQSDLSLRCLHMTWKVYFRLMRHI